MDDRDLKQTTEYLEIQEVEPPVLPDLATPEKGKAWKRKADGLLYYGDLYFGYITHTNGRELKTPRKETEKDFELVDVEDISP